MYFSETEEKKEEKSNDEKNKMDKIPVMHFSDTEREKSESQGRKHYSRDSEIDSDDTETEYTYEYESDEDSADKSTDSVSIQSDKMDDDYKRKANEKDNSVEEIRKKRHEHYTDEDLESEGEKCENEVNTDSDDSEQESYVKNAIINNEHNSDCETENVQFEMEKDKVKTVDSVENVKDAKSESGKSETDKLNNAEDRTRGINEMKEKIKKNKKVKEKENTDFKHHKKKIVNKQSKQLNSVDSSYDEKNNNLEHNESKKSDGKVDQRETLLFKNPNFYNKCKGTDFQTFSDYSDTENDDDDDDSISSNDESAYSSSEDTRTHKSLDDTQMENEQTGLLEYTNRHIYSSSEGKKMENREIYSRQEGRQITASRSAQTSSPLEGRHNNRFLMARQRCNFSSEGQRRKFLQTRREPAGSSTDDFYSNMENGQRTKKSRQRQVNPKREEQKIMLKNEERKFSSAFKNSKHSSNSTQDLCNTANKSELTRQYTDIKQLKEKKRSHIPSRHSVSLEEKLEMNYQELNKMLRKKPDIKWDMLCQIHMLQMERLYEQYALASNGRRPPVMLIPRGLPKEMQTNFMPSSHKNTSPYAKGKKNFISGPNEVSRKINSKRIRKSKSNPKLQSAESSKISQASRKNQQDCNTSKTSACCVKRFPKDKGVSTFLSGKNNSQPLNLSKSASECLIKEQTQNVSKAKSVSKAALFDKNRFSPPLDDRLEIMHKQGKKTFQTRHVKWERMKRQMAYKQEIALLADLKNKKLAVSEHACEEWLRKKRKDDAQEKSEAMILKNDWISEKDDPLSQLHYGKCVNSNNSKRVISVLERMDGDLQKIDAKCDRMDYLKPHMPDQPLNSPEYMDHSKSDRVKKGFSLKKTKSECEKCNVKQETFALKTKMSKHEKANNSCQGDVIKYEKEKKLTAGGKKKAQQQLSYDEWLHRKNKGTKKVSLTVQLSSCSDPDKASLFFSKVNYPYQLKMTQSLLKKSKRPQTDPCDKTNSANSSENLENNVRSTSNRLSYDDWLCKKRNEVKNLQSSLSCNTNPKFCSPKVKAINIHSSDHSSGSNQTDVSKNFPDSAESESSANSGCSKRSRYYWDEEKKQLIRRPFDYVKHHLETCNNAGSDKTLDLRIPKLQFSSCDKVFKMPKKKTTSRADLILERIIAENLPYPECFEVPERIAERQKKLFSKEFGIFSYEKRPEPQGSDFAEVSACDKSNMQSDGKLKMKKSRNEEVGSLDANTKIKSETEKLQQNDTETQVNSHDTKIANQQTNVETVEAHFEQPLCLKSVDLSQVKEERFLD